MPTARAHGGAVHIPSLGELVLGGLSENEPKLHTAELLESAEMGEDDAPTWKGIGSMIKPRKQPLAVYFESSVIVVSLCEESVEMLSITNGRPGQWTLLSNCTLPCKYPQSMCTFNGLILLAGKL